MSITLPWRRPKKRPADLPPYERGLLYEEAAARWLKKEYGFTLLEKNYVFRQYEIDLILKQGDLICFTEVKSRLQGTRFDPLSAVDGVKRRGIRQAAVAYLQALRRDGIDTDPLLFRCDVVTAEFDEDGVPRRFVLYADYMEIDDEDFRSAL